jgi:hypothetical protein
MQSHKIKKRGNAKIKKGRHLQNFKKGGNSNLIDCNAIAQNKKGGNSKIKKGRQLQFNRLQCNRAKLKKGGNSNLIVCNAIAQNKKGGNSNI